MTAPGESLEARLAAAIEVEYDKANAFGGGFYPAPSALAAALAAVVAADAEQAAADGSWVCGRCGDSPEAHATSNHVYDPVFRVLRDAEQAAAEEVRGPSAYEGFRGCTDRDPDHCACATYADPECIACSEEIADGDLIFERLAPEYPYIDRGSTEQEWRYEAWHAACDLRAALEGPPS